jgi:hypothetical protein
MAATLLELEKFLPMEHTSPHGLISLAMDIMEQLLLPINITPHATPLSHILTQIIQSLCQMAH